MGKRGRSRWCGAVGGEGREKEWQNEISGGEEASLGLKDRLPSREDFEDKDEKASQAEAWNSCGQSPTLWRSKMPRPGSPDRTKETQFLRSSRLPSGGPRHSWSWEEITHTIRQGEFSPGISSWQAFFSLRSSFGFLSAGGRFARLKLKRVRQGREPFFDGSLSQGVYSAKCGQKRRVRTCWPPACWPSHTSQLLGKRSGWGNVSISDVKRCCLFTFASSKERMLQQDTGSWTNIVLMTLSLTAEALELEGNFVNIYMSKIDRLSTFIL